MKKEDLKKEHLDFLTEKYTKLYTLKFGWADHLLTESLINQHIERVINHMDEEEYLSDIK